MLNLIFKAGVSLTKDEVYALLNHFDDSSDIPLHKGLDFESYSEKLSEHASFILCFHEEFMMGFLAFYPNLIGRFLYVPQVVVHKQGRHIGIGHRLFSELTALYNDEVDSIKLEVLKNNSVANAFYKREGFEIIEDRKEKYLLIKKINNT